ncbi:zinc dependent phospholipase C family protein [Globicatella sulfidifaciens]|uniref:Zinc dependent phospholipase C family protein n=1 Tax=Globicatella sulfidifaciens TaxID=136093 RepID=A0A7X8C3K3_9LACT|nr:zinc dependent phospholipase C family protein [Globicatella sulfidifaciens]NLJ18361.1 zinc dependent phospholipase C family protein [Globicatella sulfidifaciens]
MASIYTHHRFGLQLLELLPEQYKIIAETHRDYYLLGQQGPDIFFFNPLTLMKSDSPGMIIHKESGINFIENQKEMLLDCEWNSPEMAYFIGSLCHYLLDSNIHPLVNQLSEGEFSHLNVETELDRYYLIKDQKNPFKFKLENLIAKEPGFKKVIPKFYTRYPKGTPQNVNLGIRFFRYIKCFFHSESQIKEKFLISLLKFAGFSNFKSLIILQTPFKEAAAVNPQLDAIFETTLNRSPALIDNVFQYLMNGHALADAFKINYDGE